MDEAKESAVDDARKHWTGEFRSVAADAAPKEVLREVEEFLKPIGAQVILIDAEDGRVTFMIGKVK